MSIHYVYFSVSVKFVFSVVALQILAGILQLGNVNFSTSLDESQPCSLDDRSNGTGWNFKPFN